MTPSTARTWTMCLLTCCWLAGCESESQPKPGPAKPKPAEPVKAPAVEEKTPPPAAAPTKQDPGDTTATPAGNGTIVGVVKWSGKATKRKTIKVDADPSCARLRQNVPLLSDRLIINPNSTVQNVFVYVKSGLPPDSKWPIPQEPVVLDQKGCHYEPHVFGIMVGQTLTIRNSDNTAHNINCSPKNNNGFNIGQPKQGMQSDRNFSFGEIMVPFKCDVHPWMSAYCAVMDHPFYAVSDQQGQFVIQDVPAGQYQLATWIERKGLEPQSQTITVKAGEETEVAFTYQRP